MDLLRAAIADSKKDLSFNGKPGGSSGAAKSWKKADSSDSDSDSELKNKRFLKRGEIKRLQEKQATKEKESKRRKTQGTKPDKKSALIDKMEKQLASGNKAAAKLAREELNDIKNMIHPNEAKQLLRSYGQPLTLFGETDLDRFKRLKAYEFEKEEKEGGQAGYANAFQDIIQQEVERDIENATVAAMEGEKSEEQKKREQEKHDRLMAKRHNKYANPRPRDEFATVEEYIIFFFKRMLSLWEQELDQRSSDEKKTTKGKVASATQKQTRVYLQPMFKQLKKNEAPPDVVKRVTTIVEQCYHREYVVANEAYLTMAIGNAAWPMGVTMVGIHERAGREKIFSQNQAHVLNDETSRKYIQAIKRIMTFSQHAFPNVPSKMVM